MIKGLVEVWENKKYEIREVLSKKHPEDYEDLVKTILNTLKGYDNYEFYTDNIVEIDHGDYQGTLLYIIPGGEYQPSDYWYLMVGYGSCSGCDTLRAIQDAGYGEEIPTENQVYNYMRLALHIVQGMKKMGYDDDFRVVYD